MPTSICYTIYFAKYRTGTTVLFEYKSTEYRYHGIFILYCVHLWLSIISLCVIRSATRILLREGLENRKFL